MSHRPTPRSSFLLAATFILTWGLAVCCHAQGQVLNQDQEIFVHHLPSLTAHSQDPSDILLATLETVFHDHDVCCGRDSALGDSAEAADPHSLKDVASKLDGRHLLGDGRPIKVNAKYVNTAAMNSGEIITTIANQHAPLMEWNSHIYVVRGVVFFWTAYGGGDQGYTPVTVIRKFLLWDTRYSDSRQEVIFDRTTDDLSKVQGLLFLQAAPQ
jgi:hypothetical protein